MKKMILLMTILIGSFSAIACESHQASSSQESEETKQTAQVSSSQETKVASKKAN